MGRVTNLDAARPKVLEFFAGIGLARMGLERAGFKVAWANDYEVAKWSMYSSQFGDAAAEDHAFALGDIGKIRAVDLPDNAALAWASSPCTDLSIAGSRAGLDGSASGTFWHFIRILEELDSSRPRVVVLENVIGLATSHGGDDLAAAIRAFNSLNYSVDVMSIDARRFLPQSRPRLFIIGAQDPPADTTELSSELRPDWLQWVYGDESLVTHRAAIPAPPAPLTSGLGELIEALPLGDDRWWDVGRTEAFLQSLSTTQWARVSELRRAKGVKYRTAYRRTRNGVPVWEVRHDDIAGCLRTARGGSSRQAVVRLGNRRLQVRWMTPLEYARLMGAENYHLTTARTNQSLFGFGDAVAVPVVEWLAKEYLMPLVRGELNSTDASSRVRQSLGLS
ncbi:MAG: DNA (cytosine-5-)-methyltransferase [Cryobacterium sp.]|nr:DNA (cytosine-5-)-methyltransferase [Cryobacterium sp.]MBX3310507.1 DNA (cytosine-5-)-methyltransferase [Cryobacterium sp.]